MKWYKAYYYDNRRLEKTVVIVKAENEAAARAVLGKAYAKSGVSSDEWEIKEMQFSEDGTCEVYYGG